jgi:hypothetical protein
MKVFKRILIGLLFLTVSFSYGQVSVNVNIGTPPAWGPTGYSDVRYYYLPALEMYYDINTANYIYNNNGRWLRTKSIPRDYRNYDLYSTYKVVLSDYRGNTPYDNYKTHKIKYGKGYKGKPQKTIGHKSEKRNNKENKHQNQGHQNQGHKNQGHKNH